MGSQALRFARLFTSMSRPFSLRMRMRPRRWHRRGQNFTALNDLHAIDEELEGQTDEPSVHEPARPLHRREMT